MFKILSKNHTERSTDRDPEKGNANISETSHLFNKRVLWYISDKELDQGLKEIKNKKYA